MKKLIFRNPFKEALYIQGKRWLAAFLVAMTLMFMLGIVAFYLGMHLLGSVAAVAVLLGSGIFLYHFACETVEGED